MALAQEYIQPRETITAVPKQKVKTTVIPKQKVSFDYWKFIITSAVLLCVLATGTILSSMLVSNRNQQLQEMKQSVKTMERDSEVLMQEAEELAQYDRVVKIAKQKGLQMQEQNVRNVTQ